MLTVVFVASLLMQKVVGYFLVSQSLTWSNANIYCESNYNTSLATISNENDAINALESSDFEDVWIGLNWNNIDDTLLWIDGTNVSYTLWAPNEPQTSDGSSICGYLKPFPSGAYWNGISCESQKYFLCNQPETSNLTSDNQTDDDNICDNNATQFYSCADWMEFYPGWSLSNGNYQINNTILSESLTVYCVFDYTNQFAWTLIESANLNQSMNKIDEPWTENAEYNSDSVDIYRDTVYRLSRDWMRWIQIQSTHLFATCNFNTNFEQDWVLFNMDEMEYNPFYNQFDETCISTVSANIEGESCSDGTIALLQSSNSHIIVSDSDLIDNNCSCSAIANQDYFGRYDNFGDSFTCSSQSDNATTNWWVGKSVTKSCQDVDGGGWQLVRHVSSSGGVHPATDTLAGTDEYGTYDGNETSNETWSILFSDIEFNQFLFSFGDCSHWLVVKVCTVVGTNYENVRRCILSSSISLDSAYRARWYNRAGAQEDPLITLEDYGECTVGENSCLLYREGSGNPGSFQIHQGANVWIRQKYGENRCTSAGFPEPIACPTLAPTDIPSVTSTSTPTAFGFSTSTTSVSRTSGTSTNATSWTSTIVSSSSSFLSSDQSSTTTSVASESSSLDLQPSAEPTDGDLGTGQVEQTTVDTTQKADQDQSTITSGSESESESESETESDGGVFFSLFIIFVVLTSVLCCALVVVVLFLVYKFKISSVERKVNEEVVMVQIESKASAKEAPSHANTSVSQVEKLPDLQLLQQEFRSTKQGTYTSGSRGTRGDANIGANVRSHNDDIYAPVDVNENMDIDTRKHAETAAQTGEKDVFESSLLMGDNDDNDEQGSRAGQTVGEKPHTPVSRASTTLK